MMSTPRNWASLDELLLAISDVLVLEKRAIGVNEVGYDNDRPLHVAAVGAADERRASTPSSVLTR
jgi:hypothetical protein